MADPISAVAGAFAQWATATFINVTGSTSLAAAQTAYAVAYATAYVATSAAITLGLNAVARSQLPDPEAGKFTRRQARPVRTVAMGDASRFSGAYMFRETVNEHLGVVLALNDGRLASIDKIWLNDDLVSLNGDGWVQPMSDGRYGGGDLVRIRTRLGQPTETWYSELAAKFSAWWTSSHRGDGIASLMMLAQHRSQESTRKHFPNGEPVPSVAGPGVCFDWRDPTQDREDESSWKACSCPIVWLVHYEWFRRGRSWERCIEPVLEALTAEADYCDALTAKLGGTERRYRFGGWYPVDLKPQSVRELVLAACDGWMTTDGRGRLVIKAGRYEEPTFILTGEYILGYTWRRGSPAEKLINKLIVSFVDPSKDYTEVEADPWIDEASVAAIGEEKSEPLQLRWVQSLSQARRLAKRKMSRLQAGRRGQIVCDLHGLNALGHRYIRVQNPELASMADIVVEVMQAEPDLARGIVTLDVILADPAIDAWNPATEEGEPAAEVERPPQEVLPDPTITSVTPFFEDAGSGVGVRLAIQGGGPDREDLTWFARWRVNGDASWSESQYTDAAAGPPVLLETGFVPSDVLLQVQIAYRTGDGTLSAWAPTPPAEIGPVTIELLIGEDGQDLISEGGDQLIEE